MLVVGARHSCLVWRVKAHRLTFESSEKITGVGAVATGLIVGGFFLFPEQEAGAMGSWGHVPNAITVP